MDQYWLEVAIDTTPDCLDDVAAYLTGCGIVGLSLENEADLNEFMAENKAYWDEVDDDLKAAWKGVSRVKFYVTEDEDGKARLAEVEGGLEAFRQRVGKDVGTLAVSTTSLREEDWSENWKQYYQPFPVGEKLYVVPEWMRGEPVPEGRQPVYLNPGLIFGTGSHATTRMCLEAMETLAAPDKRVLDLGCGSGILSIGALVLGCREAVGCDIDPKAPDVAMDNAALNGIGADRFRVYAGDILADRGMRAALGTNFDIVLANIVADVILPLAPLSREFLAPGGTFVTSGIIEGRQDEIEHALKKAGYSIEKHFCEEEWHCFVCSVRE